MEGKLRQFLRRHGDDPRARLVGVYLGWSLVEQGRLEAAEAVLAPVLGGPAGGTRDLAQIAAAAILLARSQPERALSLLRPLDGKLIDPAEQFVFAELHVRAAVAARRWQETTEAMLDWVADVQPETSELVPRAIAALLPRIPDGPLERSLRALEPASKGENSASPRTVARAWLARELRARLSAVALARGDVALGRRLLASAPPAARKSEVGRKLAQLTAGSAVRPHVAGRAFGLVLSVGTPELRRRSAAIAAGVTRALGLLEPHGPSTVHLLTRDESGTEHAMQEALASLAGDGAVILGAGLDAEGAQLATAYAEQAHIPMILFFPPAQVDPGAEYAFTLGSDPREPMTLLTGELGRLGAKRIATVGGDGAPCTFGPAAKRNRVDALVVLGDADCTGGLVRDLANARLYLGLGLETSELADSLTGDSFVVAVGAGDFPRTSAGPPPSWFEALGHDAAELVRSALRDFPTERVDDAKSVTGLHRRAQGALLAAEADLWSTERRGFAGAHRISRAWRLVTRAPRGAKPRRSP